MVVKDEDSVLVAVAVEVAVTGPVVITLPGADNPDVADKEPDVDPEPAELLEDWPPVDELCEMTVDEDCPPGTAAVVEVEAVVDPARLVEPVEVDEPAGIMAVDDALGDLVTGWLDDLIGVDDPAGIMAVLEECPEQL